MCMSGGLGQLVMNTVEKMKPNEWENKRIGTKDEVLHPICSSFVVTLTALHFFKYLYVNLQLIP